MNVKERMLSKCFVRTVYMQNIFKNHLQGLFYMILYNQASWVWIKKIKALAYISDHVQLQCFNIFSFE